MNVLDIPFNAFLKIETPPAGSPYVFQLQESPHYLNHVGTVHASVQLSLAEASSGQWLMQAMPELADKVIALVRRVEGKFKNPITGTIFSRPTTSVADMKSSAESLATKGRAIIPVTIEIVDRSEKVGLVATFEWFATNRP